MRFRAYGNPAQALEFMHAASSGTWLCLQLSPSTPSSHQASGLTDASRRVQLRALTVTSFRLFGGL
jgi:hypothetical protein